MPAKKQNSFKLRGFIEVNPGAVTRLEEIGIRNTVQMLS